MDNSKETDDVLRLARERFDNAWQYDQENREEAREDLHFRAGDQWPKEIKSDRDQAQRPCLTTNLVPQFIKQVTGEIRQNRPSIKVRPVDSGSDPKVAEIYSGIIRHIEQSCDAQAAYITSAESAASCGIGHFRVLTDYAYDEGFEQDIRIQRIRNPFAVYWDPDATELTREDAKWCFVSERISLEAFKERYPGKKTVDFEGNDSVDWLKNWWDGETVRIAEYWAKVPETRKVALVNGEVVDFAEGMEAERTREITSHRVIRYVMNGVEMLEGPDEFPCRYIPIIPVLGEEVHIGDRVVRHGLVRFLKDPQRMYNYWRTTAVEAIALAPKAPWVLTPRMIEGQKASWEVANKGNPPYLLYNPDNLAPQGPQRQMPPPPPAAMWREAEIASNDMHGTTGIYPPSLGAKSNETSGRAILARQQEGDTSTFVYIDNLSRSIRYAGKILVALIPKIYDTNRVVRILGEDDAEEFVELNAPLEDGSTATLVKDKGGVVVYPNLELGKYDVEVVTGPSHATKRLEAADAMIQFTQAVPQAGAVIADLVAKNMDWPGADQIAERLKKVLPPGLADDEEEMTPEQMQARQAAQQQAAMAQQIALAKAQADIAKAQASAAKDAASVRSTMAGIGKTQAETDGVSLDNAQKAFELMMADGTMQFLIQQIVSQQLQELVAPQAPMGGEFPQQ